MTGHKSTFWPPSQVFELAEQARCEPNLRCTFPVRHVRVPLAAVPPTRRWLSKEEDFQRDCIFHESSTKNVQNAKSRSNARKVKIVCIYSYTSCPIVGLGLNCSGKAGSQARHFGADVTGRGACSTLKPNKKLKPPAVDAEWIGSRTYLGPE